MANFQNTSNSKLFSPAQLRKGSDWYVEYYVLNPNTDRLSRKRIRINHIRNKNDRRKYGKLLVDDINQRLFSGWNPFIEKEAPKAMVKLTEAVPVFLKEKKKELRKAGYRTYHSLSHIFINYLLENKKEKLATIMFTKTMAKDYLNYLYEVNKISNRTYNNYLLFQRTLFYWLIDNGYCTDNPFEKIKKKIPKEKNRSLIDASTRLLIKNYLQQQDKHYLAIVLLIFHALIRPKELTFLKAEHFDLANQIVIIPATAAKNRNMRVATLPNSIIPHLKALNIEKMSSDEFVFSRNYKPGTEQMESRYISKGWEKVRKALNFNVSVKLYSLRDSGIIQMLSDGIPPQEVMRQADHSSLEMTTIYLKHANPTGSEIIKNKSEAF